MTPVLSILMIATGLLCTDRLLAQPVLRIISPNDKAVVHPGETITVKIEASGAALTGAMIAAEDPIKAGQVLSRPPYRFSITIPAKTTPGLYTLVAEGASPTSDIPSSEPISIDVERLDSPQSIATDVTHLDLKVGEQSAIDVTGTYPDGSHVRLTKSTQTNYETVPAGVVSVTRDGLVTALAAGSVTIVVHHQGRQAAVKAVVIRR